MKTAQSAEYQILTNGNPNQLQEEVAEYLFDGFKLAGGLAVYEDEMGKPVFCQAVVQQD
jgi:hypothetical protein